jgi:ribosome recycling factor
MLKDDLQQALDALKANLELIKASRPTTALLDCVRVRQDSKAVKLSHIAALSINRRAIVVKPFDLELLPKIEHAILDANLNLVPYSNGSAVCVPLPLPTKKYRDGLVKEAKAYGEEAKALVRQARKLALNAAMGCPIEDERKPRVNAIEVAVRRAVNGIEAATKAKVDRILKVFSDLAQEPKPRKNQ